MEDEGQQHGQNPERTGIDTVDETNHKRRHDQRTVAQVHVADEGNGDNCLVRGNRSTAFGCSPDRLLDLERDGVVEADPSCAPHERPGDTLRLDSVLLGHTFKQGAVLLVVPDFVLSDLQPGELVLELAEPRLLCGAVGTSVAPEELELYGGVVRAACRHVRP